MKTLIYEMVQFQLLRILKILEFYFEHIEIITNFQFHLEIWIQVLPLPLVGLLYDSSFLLAYKI
jgi:hypothetical protein